MDADLEEYENAMLEEECEMMYAGPEGVEPCAQRMGRPTRGQCPRPRREDDDCMQDIQYDHTVSRETDEYDGMESDEVGAAQHADVCRGQKRRLHTVCEISYVARSKMTKQLEPGVT